MEKIELLINLGLSQPSEINTQTQTDTDNSTSYNSQQNIILNQEYYSYNSQVGVSLVNDLNVKNFLNRPENEKTAKDFINYLKGFLTTEEFRDLFYDNKKLAEFFNIYYQKFINYSNQGIDDSLINKNINLEKTKDSLFNSEERYLKTNSFTNYYTNRVLNNGQFRPNNYSDVTRPSDYIDFTGNTKSYYVNFRINTKFSMIDSYDFSRYFVDVCNKIIKYSKYTYINSYTENFIFGNIDEILRLQKQTNSGFGPSVNSLNYIKSFLPINYLNSLTSDNNFIASSEPQEPKIILQDGIYQNSNANEIIIIPQPLPKKNQKQNFKNFNEFKQFFNWEYKNYRPNFLNKEEADQKYIYQSVINLTSILDFVFKLAQLGPLIPAGYLSPEDLSLFYAIVGGTYGRGNGIEKIVNLVEAEFEFVVNPDTNSLDFKGILYEDIYEKTIKIDIKHRNISKSDTIIVKHEDFSPSRIGEDNGINSYSFINSNNNNANNNTIEVNFNIGESIKSIRLKIYKNWNPRYPIVLSLRPINNPNQINSYLVIYLEDFFDLTVYNFNEEIQVSDSLKCELFYNGFVNQNFNDNFLEKYRPDNIPIKYLNGLGFSIQESFEAEEEFNVNQKLYSIFNDSSLTLASIARKINVPQSAIFNIYINGSYYYGSNQADSDADITVVADVNMDVQYFTVGNIDFSLYNPRTFQFQLNEFGVPAFPNSILISDRNFFQYFTEEDTYKILERIEFTTNITNNKFKDKAFEISKTHFEDSEILFRARDFERFRKRLWSSIRVLVLSIQYLKFGKITDRKAANTYISDLQRRFNNFEEVKNYATPILRNLRNEILLL